MHGIFLSTGPPLGAREPAAAADYVWGGDPFSAKIWINFPNSQSQPKTAQELAW